MNINLIWAQTRNGVIGHHGAMPWHIPEDLAHFRAVTQDHPVIMGRKTWDSLPERFRPLPRRRNIVLTRQPNWGSELTNVLKANSIESAIKPQIVGSGVKEVWVIGGGQIYQQYLGRAARAEVTEIDADMNGDTLAPTLSPKEWLEIGREHHVSPSGLAFDFVSYRRISGVAGQHALF